MIAASAGNHALALAYHGSDLRIPVTVVMPHIAPLMKVQMCKHYGANIIMHGADISEVRRCALVIRSFHGIHNVADRGILQLGDVGRTCGQSWAPRSTHYLLTTPI